MSRQKLLMPTLAALLGIAILCGLGTWQLKRLEWKMQILTALDTEYAKDAAQVKLSPPKTQDKFLFRRGTMHGAFDFNNQVLVGPRVYGNIPGYNVITPFRLEDGSWILVNRGWVSQHWNPADEDLGKIQGRDVAVIGLMRLPDESPFRPPNIPDKNQWYTINTHDFAVAKRVEKLSPYVLYEENNGNTATYPIANATRPQLDNNHLQYAAFWFTMAGVLVTMYVLRFIKK